VIEPYAATQPLSGTAADVQAHADRWTSGAMMSAIFGLMSISVTGTSSLRSSRSEAF
jgi:hypothetical protein